MEEDIKILEEIINNIKKYDTYRYDWTETDVQTVEHLIKAYKELKEEVMQKDLEIIGVEEYTKESMGEIIEHYYTANEDSIPVSLVEEKIEELNKLLEEDLQDERKLNSNRFIIICQCKSCLQELLEKR